MIRNLDRKVAMLLVRLRIWKAERGLFRTVVIYPKRGTRWLLELMKRRQARDDAHHAPACPANHWHYTRLVFQPCTCGASPRGVPASDDQRSPSNPFPHP